jgi:hypothetical protein
MTDFVAFADFMHHWRSEMAVITRSRCTAIFGPVEIWTLAVW